MANDFRRSQSIMHPGNPIRFSRRFLSISAIAVVLLAFGSVFSFAAETSLLNVSFDISRELYRDVNSAFARQWKEKTGDTVIVKQSHAGSSKQARAVIDGLAADVVTFNQDTDIDAIAEKGKLLPANWRSLLPDHSAPYTSTIVFLVRKGNPKRIKDWDDLVKPGVAVIIPNPKTSGNGRYSYLAAYAFALKKFNKDDARARSFIEELFKHVPVLDTGGRGATTTFVDREVGDVLLTFEAEALLARKETGGGKFDLVLPPQSIATDMPVAVVEKVARKRGTTTVARAYLEFLYTEQGQELAARHFFRPRSKTVAAKYETQFGKIELATIDDVFGGWSRAQAVHFSEGGVFDQIQQKRR
jgi:sulfate/thiosulfate-binding protein